jgi:hypothetical protein
MNRLMQIFVAVVILVVACAASFYGGVLYGKGQPQGASTAAAATGAPTGRGQGFAPPAGQAGTVPGQGGMLSGEIQGVAGGVMTILDSTGKQSRVTVTDTTLIQKQAAVTLADLQKGETVFVSGSQGSDGVITARSVQVISGGVPGGNLPAGDQGGGIAPGAARP